MLHVVGWHNITAANAFSARSYLRIAAFGAR
jgi:hypothetical protein